MAKAVLVMDMPKNCFDCLVCDGEYSICEKIGSDVIEYGRSIPDWCPLIPEPKRFITTQSVIKDHDVDVVSWYMGWNACLDALEGKENE